MSQNKGYYNSIKLESLTENEYEKLKKIGILYVYYPEATGSYNNDVLTVPNRVDIIGQNGNDGQHYSELFQEAYDTQYRVPMSDNPDGIGYDVFNDHQWKHVLGDSYSDKVKKVIEDTYGIEKDNMFVDDYVEKVKQPSHYEIGETGLEAIDVIEATLTKEEYIGYLRGNILKYNLRANKKNGSEDLRKADIYSGWLVEALEE